MVDREALVKAADEIWGAEAHETAINIARRTVTAYLDARRAKGWGLMPREPTPEMIAAALPVTGVDRAPAVVRIAEQALFLLEPADIELPEHRQGLEAALYLITDYRAMFDAFDAALEPGEMK